MSAKLSHCPKCGAEVAPDAQTCNTCGEPLTGVSTEPGAAPLKSNAPGTRQRIAYAGFWLRLLAYLLDSLLLGLVLGAVLRPILISNHVGTSMQDLWRFYSSGTRQATAFVLLIHLANWLYFASFESSAWLATPGKKILGLRVTDLAGKRIDFVRASGRYFGKYVSVLIVLIGFLMAGFTAKKQALHDIFAGCLVLRKI